MTSFLFYRAGRPSLFPEILVTWNRFAITFSKFYNKYKSA